MSESCRILVKNVKWFFGIVVVLSALAGETGFAQSNEVIAGPLFSKFVLTQLPGERFEAVGPFYYSQKVESQTQWALPPVFCSTRTPEVEWKEAEVAYPIFSYRQFGPEYRYQLFELIAFSGGELSTNAVKRITFFPIYFQQRAPDTNLNYTALMPIYGELKNRLFRDDIKAILFPLFSETRKKDVVTDNYLYPIFDVRRGDHLKGWQVWPFYGVEHKEPTYQTNWDQQQVVGGFDKYFVMFPFYFTNRLNIGTTNEAKSRTIIPFYSETKSPSRDELSYGWPLGYNIIDDREKGYTERDFFWPGVVKAHGTKEVTRYFPFYSQARTVKAESDFDLLAPDGGKGKSGPEYLAQRVDNFYMWPVYKFNLLDTRTSTRERTRILFFLYSDITETNHVGPGRFHRVDGWPFFSYRREWNGDQRWQVLGILDSLFPNNRSITREYVPIYSFWRWEKNHKTGATSQSLFWNLYRREQRDDAKKYSLLFGLIQYQTGLEGGHWRVVYVNLGKKPRRAANPAS